MSPMMPDVNTLKTERVAPPLPSVAPVRLNDVFQKILQPYQQQINKGNIIIRCEALPVVEANENELHRLFENIFFILFSDDVSGTRHFLHINCAEEKDNDIIDLTNREHKSFQIQFSSNRNYEIIWTEMHRNKIDECYSILSRHNGNLILDPQKSSGCSFIVSLPGKLS